MCSFKSYDFPEANVYKMMEQIGIELGGGVIPRFSLMYASAVRTCLKCESVDACSKWLGAASATSVAPDFCPNADIFFELEFDGLAIPRTTAMH
jgi:hypothetical protein